MLTGVKSKGRALLKMDNITFTYPGNTIPTINNATVRVSLSSRVACLGRNGAGKSTMIKLLTGELEPNEGSGAVWKHQGVRLGYIAQHAFHHLERHLDQTANEYIRWRYQFGEDKEGLEKVTMVVTDEERAALDVKIEVTLRNAEGAIIKKEKRTIDELTGNRRNTPGSRNPNDYEYECSWKGMRADSASWERGERLEKLGWGKFTKAINEKIAAAEGLYRRALTVKNVEEHLEDVGLDREFGTHNRIKALSGGQKVKVVLAASMWNQPHIIILDEPTNYLDRESLGALAGAIEEYEGGVVMITHNNEFCSQLCPETWLVQDGKCDCKGDAEWMKNAMKEAVEFKAMETMTDAMGNEVKVKQEKKKLSRREAKQKAKEKKMRIARGETVTDSEDED
jgi:elongation factor 3